MDSNKEKILNDSIVEVMQTLPPPIREYIQKGEHTAVVENLRSTYGLHIDQEGILGKEVVLLLMGIDNPDEFARALAEEARLDTATINSITRDVNEQIFVPLRQKMQEGSAKREAPTPPRPVPPPPAYIPTQQTVIPANPSLPQRAPQAPVAVKPPQSETPAFSINKLSSGVYSIINHVEGGRMMLEDKEEPHIDIHRSTRAMPPPPNLPGVMPPPPVNTQQWASNTTPRPIPPPPARPAAPPLPAQPYSSDPYREPIDGNQ